MTTSAMPDGCHRAKRRRRSHALPRRKTVRWSSAEVDGLLEGVREHGVGKWAAILRSSACFNAVRTSVDLKDKWRNLAAHVRALALQGAPTNSSASPLAMHKPDPAGSHLAVSLSACSPVTALGSPVASPPRRPRPDEPHHLQHQPMHPRIFAKPDVPPLTFKGEHYGAAVGVGSSMGMSTGASGGAGPGGPGGPPQPLHPAHGLSTSLAPLAPSVYHAPPHAQSHAMAHHAASHPLHHATSHPLHHAASHPLHHAAPPPPTVAASSVRTAYSGMHARILAPLPMPIAPAPGEQSPIAPMPAIPELPAYFGDFAPRRSAVDAPPPVANPSQELAHLRALPNPAAHHSPHDAVPTAAAPDANPPNALGFDPFPVGDADL